MAELKQRKEPKFASKMISINVERKIGLALRAFVNDEHPLRPTQASAAEVAIEMWIDSEREKIRDGAFEDQDEDRE
jgi:hypothetical protein